MHLSVFLECSLLLLRPGVKLPISPPRGKAESRNLQNTPATDPRLLHLPIQNHSWIFTGLLIETWKHLALWTALYFLSFEQDRTHQSVVFHSLERLWFPWLWIYCRFSYWEVLLFGEDGLGIWASDIGCKSQCCPLFAVWSWARNLVCVDIINVKFVKWE